MSPQDFEPRADTSGRYPHPHHSRLIYKPGPTTPSRSLRPIARLPSRAFPPPSPSRTSSGSRTPDRDDIAGDGEEIISMATRLESGEIGHGVRNDGIDWKMMLRLGTNWYVQLTVVERSSPIGLMAMLHLLAVFSFLHPRLPRYRQG